MDTDHSYSRTEHEQKPSDGEGSSSKAIPVTLSLPDIPPTSEFDLELAISSVVGAAPTEQEEKLHKRASSVLKLTEENEKLRAELKAMTDRLEAAERRKQVALKARAREQHIMEPPSS